VDTYRELFRTPEYKPFFASFLLQNAATTVSGLALATLVYSRTSSPALSALALFGPALAQLVGANTLLSAADRLRPRQAIVLTTLMFAAASALQAIPNLALGAAFALLFVQGMVASLSTGVRIGLLHEVLTNEGYVLGRSVTSMAGSAIQIVGYAAGAGLVALFTAQGTLLVGSALFLGSALCALLLRERSARISGRGGAGQSWRTNRLLLGSRSRFPIYLAMWVPNGLIVGAESLFPSLAPGQAGFLFASAAAGSLAGSVIVGRFVAPNLRGKLAAPLRLLLALPYLGFAFGPPLPVASALIFTASIGFAASLLLQEQLMRNTPKEFSGHGFGLASSGLLAAQGVGAAIAGVTAELTSPSVAITAVAGVSALVTVCLAASLRRSQD
jgi:predicted MFS family arabinose efflux permease